MKNLLLCSFSLLGVLFALSAKPKLADRVPHDAFLIVAVDDWEDFAEKIETGPFGSFSRSPAWEKMSEWMESEMEGGFKDEPALEEMMETLESWKDSMKGEILFSIGGLDRMLESEAFDKKVEEGEEMDFSDVGLPFITLMMETGKTEKDLLKTLRAMKKEIKRSDGDFAWEQSAVNGTTVHWIGSERDEEKDKKMALFMQDEVMHFVMGGEEHVRDVLLLASGDSAESLSGNDQYLDLFDEIGSGEARIFLNFRPLMSMLLKMSENPGLQMPENPFGLTTDGIVEALGLDSLDSMGMQFDPRGGEFSMSVALFLSKYEGLFSLMEPDDKEVKLRGFLPPNLLSASSARYDMSQIWPKLSAMLEKMSPQLMLLVNAQIQAFEDQIGVPFRKNVLGSLGDEVISLSRLNPGWAENLDFLFSDDLEEEDLEQLPELVEAPTNDVFLIALRDPKLFDQSLRATLDGAMQGAELFKETKYNGVLVRSMRGLEQAGVSISYAVADKWLLLSMGEPQLLNQVIDGMQSEKKSLWDQKEIKVALRDIPEGASQVEYFDFSRLMDMLTPMMDELMKDQGLDWDLDPGDLPDFPYFMLGWAKSVKGGVVSSVKLYPKAGK